MREGIGRGNRLGRRDSEPGRARAWSCGVVAAVRCVHRWLVCAPVPRVQQRARKRGVLMNARDRCRSLERAHRGVRGMRRREIKGFFGEGGEVCARCGSTMGGGRKQGRGEQGAAGLTRSAYFLVLDCPLPMASLPFRFAMRPKMVAPCKHRRQAAHREEDILRPGKHEWYGEGREMVDGIEGGSSALHATVSVPPFPKVGLRRGETTVSTPWQTPHAVRPREASAYAGNESVHRRWFGAPCVLSRARWPARVLARNCANSREPLRLGQTSGKLGETPAVTCRNRRARTVPHTVG